MFTWSSLIPAVALAVLLGGSALAVVERAEAARAPRRERASAGVAAPRLALYGMAFAGLVATLIAASGLLALLVGMLTVQAATLLGGEALRQQASLDLALLLVGAPLWLGCWLAVQRRAASQRAEQHSFVRRLFFAAVFAATAVTALFGAEGLARFLLTLPGAANAQPSALGGIAAGARFLVYGVAWWGYRRLAADEGEEQRPEQRIDQAHDLARYVVAAFALGVLALGLVDTLQELATGLLRLAPRPLDQLVALPERAPWTVWGGIAAQVLTGGMFWLVVWRADLALVGRRPLRIAYLYAVLIVAAPAALVAATVALYELLRRLFGYALAFGSAWDFVRDTLPPLLVGGAVWLYHWGVLRRQGASLPTSAERAVAAPGVAWPRRPAVAALAFVGLAATASALGAIIWVGLDALLVGGAALSTPDWQRDRLSLAIAAGAVGALAWLGPWSVWQRAAEQAPRHERGTLERRLYVGGAALAAALAALGFLIALLWLLLQAALGAPFDVADADSALKDGSALAIALGIAAYHAALFRADVRAAGPRKRRLTLLTLLTPAAEPTLAALRRQVAPRLDVIGQVETNGRLPDMDLAALLRALAALEDAGEREHALLILHPDGGTLYPYQPLAA